MIEMVHFPDGILIAFQRMVILIDKSLTKQENLTMKKLVIGVIIILVLWNLFLETNVMAPEDIEMSLGVITMVGFFIGFRRWWFGKLN